MPKSQYIAPEDVRSQSWIEFDKIPVNIYQKTVKDEKDNFSKDEFLRIYHDMRMIREFEEMLMAIKVASNYNGVEYNNPGPAHLSIGQEASAVGQAYHLTPNDFIFGSHRSHGELLAKSFSAINKMDDAELQKVMEGYMDGRAYSVVEPLKDKRNTVKKMAISYILYGVLAEIFAKETGFNQGLGGSMHSYFLPFGVYPNNAIVGGSGDISVGAALFKKINQQDGIVVANIGDGALGCGPVWEAFMMATMDQYKELWEGDMKGGLPILFNITNNQYAMGGQPRGETMGFQYPARIGAGLNPEQMHAERIDGYNPLAVIEAMERKLDLLRNKRGPVLLDVVTYRYSGHSPSDANSYREQTEIEAWQKVDSIPAFARQLVEAGVASENEIKAIDEEVVDVITDTIRLAVDPVKSPRMDLSKDPSAIERLMFSNLNLPALSDAKPDMLLAREDVPRVKQLSKKLRYAYDDEGKAVSTNRVYQFRDAIFESVLDAFYTDPTLIAYGEENRDWGGAFACYRGLTEAVPYHRLFNSPISEGAIVGSAVGYAMAGGRALVELMYSDFLGRAGDEVFNQLPKWQAMSGGMLKMPVVVRVSVGSKYGAQHSQDWTSLCTHIPGLKVVFPATPYDAKGMLTSALRGTDPVIFFESQRLYGIGEEFVTSGVPEESYEIPLGEPVVRRQGSDVTILTIGATMYPALKAAAEMQEKYSISAEVIDARSLVPFNYDLVLESVKKTGKCIVASDACARGSYLNDIARTLQELAFDYLDAPVTILGSRNWITPAHELEEEFFPQPSWFIDIYHQRIAPIEGYSPTQSFTDIEMLRRSKYGF
ncbi:MAG: dehydrogenase [Clostridiaceae bacterium]|jgi:2-oxoisovalerate dehydrogenase E1 component|nr:dehydrogenase [Clostridiaceae bacterium]